MREVSFVVVNYNGITTVLDTITSIYAMQGVQPHVIVVDDGSTDGSPEAIQRKFPKARVYQEVHNTREVNRLRNKGLRLAKTRNVFLTDNDVTFDSRCILELLRIMEEEANVGACIPRLMYLNDRSRIYSEGSKVHYLGATIAPTRDLPVVYRKDRQEIAVGGGIALLDKKKLGQVGGFDEDYEMAWGDDGELHQRLLLAGYKCLYVPSAVGYHEYKPFDKTRHYRARGQLHNRWRFILTHYARRTLVLIAPALALFECVQMAFYVLKGIPLLYVKGTFDAARELPAILRRRKEIQALRNASDRDILFAGPLYVRPVNGLVKSLVSVAIGVLSRAFSAYWWLVQPVLSSEKRERREAKKNQAVM